MLRRFEIILCFFEVVTKIKLAGFGSKSSPQPLIQTGDMVYTFIA
jgi:hypothetical protein